MKEKEFSVDLVNNPPHYKDFGFEIKKDFFKSANEIMLKHIERSLFA